MFEFFYRYKLAQGGSVANKQASTSKSTITSTSTSTSTNKSKSKK